MLTPISLLEHVQCKHCSDTCVCSTTCREDVQSDNICTLGTPLLGSGVERHVDVSVPVHGPGDVVGEEGVRVLQPLVQQQLLCLHRPVLHDVL